MSSALKEEYELLKKTLKAIRSFNYENLDFNSEAALIRHFEVIGGIAKTFAKFNITSVKNNDLWKKAIWTRDKISHSYYLLDVSMLTKAFKDIPLLIASLKEIESEIKKIG